MSVRDRAQPERGESGIYGTAMRIFFVFLGNLNHIKPQISRLENLQSSVDGHCAYTVWFKKKIGMQCLGTMEFY